MIRQRDLMQCGAACLAMDIDTFKKYWVSSTKNGFEQGIALTLLTWVLKIKT